MTPRLGAHLNPFAIVCSKSFIFMFTLGNISAVAATCFLVGPGRQWRNMITRERIGSASAFIGSMFGTLVACVWVRSL